MKKTYINPITEILSVQTAPMLTGSFDHEIGVYIPTVPDDPGDGEDLARGNSVWDE